jgi:hypothetical protein
MFVFLCRVLDPIRLQATCVPSGDPCNVRSLLSCTGHFDEIYTIRVERIENNFHPKQNIPTLSGIHPGYSYKEG